MNKEELCIKALVSMVIANRTAVKMIRNHQVSGSSPDCGFRTPSLTTQ